MRKTWQVRVEGREGQLYFSSLEELHRYLVSVTEGRAYEYVQKTSDVFEIFVSGKVVCEVKRIDG